MNSGCTGTALYRYTAGAWCVMTDDCVGTCNSSSQACKKTDPISILGNPELEEAHSDVLDILRNPTEGAELSTTCMCQ